MLPLQVMNWKKIKPERLPRYSITCLGAKRAPAKNAQSPLHAMATDYSLTVLNSRVRLMKMRYVDLMKIMRRLDL
jgi:hypothetical protein